MQIRKKIPYGNLDHRRASYYVRGIRQSNAGEELRALWAQLDGSGDATEDDRVYRLVHRPADEPLSMMETTWRS